MRDPVPAMRVAATVDGACGERFLRLVLKEPREWGAFESEEEARLLVVGLLAQVLARARRMKRQG